MGKEFSGEDEFKFALRLISPVRSVYISVAFDIFGGEFVFAPCLKWCAEKAVFLLFAECLYFVFVKEKGS